MLDEPPSVDTRQLREVLTAMIKETTSKLSGVNTGSASHMRDIVDALNETLVREKFTADDAEVVDTLRFRADHVLDTRFPTRVTQMCREDLVSTVAMAQDYVKSSLR